MATRQLYRSRVNKVLGGVAGGIAEYFEIDPIIVRIIFVLLTLGHGSGLLIYIVLWLAVPENPDQPAYVKPETEDASTHKEGKKETHKTAEERLEAMGQDIEAAFKEGDRGTGDSRIAGVVLLLLGLFFLAQQLMPDFDFAQWWPIFLIIGGLWIMVGRDKREDKKKDQ